MKRVALIAMVVVLGTAASAFAGDTTISGTMSCIMPQLLEIKPSVQTTTVAAPVPQAPSVSGSSGNYQVQEEEKLVTSEEIKEKATVYTVCAK